MKWLDVAGELRPYLQRGDLDYCLQHVQGIIRGLPDSPFHHVLTVDFTNDPAEVASQFDRFVTQQEKIQLAAIYTESNGFFINPDLWYFDLFGYSTYGGHEDYDWLAYFEASYENSITLTGMESLQQVYQQILGSDVYKILDYGGDPKVAQLRAANDFCDLLVVLRFQNLIRRSIPLMHKVEVPILATAHDYDFIYEAKPPQ